MEVINALGRRKTAVARVYLKKGKGNIVVNDKDYKQYFPITTLQTSVTKPLSLTNSATDFDVTVTVEGGGITGQAEAISLGIARALVEYNAENKPTLRAAGLMTRDPRMVERKKFGQKKARKRFQFSKR
ncbi:MAG: 30S ribosomal protein S9 [Bacteroidia bacterium]|jgi:small subunit ribosomal protein S9